MTFEDHDEGVERGTVILRNGKDSGVWKIRVEKKSEGWSILARNCEWEREREEKRR